MPTVSVLIPHHRGASHLEPLLRSLYSMDLDPSQVEFTLVDNGSMDGSVEYVRLYFPFVKILHLERNLGFAPALNRAARQSEADWLVFLNNDARADADWLSNLLYAARRTQAVSLSSHLLDWQGTATQFAGGSINWFGKGFEHTTLQQDQPYEIFFPCGCGMMIRRDVFHEVGMFDEDYFMVYEDIDLGWRLRLRGYSTLLVPDAKLFHRAHASLRSLSYAGKAVFYERNSLATIYKNVEDRTLSILFPLAVREAMLRAKAVGGFGMPYRYQHDGLAILKALQAFFERMEIWREKRRKVQSCRTVSDAALFKRFFEDSHQIWAYAPTHYRRLRHPDIRPKIEALLSEAKTLLG